MSMVKYCQYDRAVEVVEMALCSIREVLPVEIKEVLNNLVKHGAMKQLCLPMFKDELSLDVTQGEPNL